MMDKLILLACLLASLAAIPAFAGETPDVIYWNTDVGKILRARIAPDADYWQLIPTFAVQRTQSYCSVASAITVLNAMPISKPVDPVYAPYAWFTQDNYFTPEVSKVINAKTVLTQGMTREEMAKTLALHGVKTESIAGDTLSDKSLRTLLQKVLGDDGQFVLANYSRATLGQVGGGHWSALAAYDEKTDRVLILDVAKYKYPPAWVGIATLRQAMNTIDTVSDKARGLVIVSK
jgi:glutathione-S-conjugate glycine hydrolase